MVPHQIETLWLAMRKVRRDYGTATAAEQTRYLPTPGPSRAGRTSLPNAGLLGALLHAVPDLVQRSVPPGHVRAKAASAEAMCNGKCIISEIPADAICPVGVGVDPLYPNKGVQMEACNPEEI